MLIKSNLHHLGGGIVNKDSALLVIGVLEQLLAEVVAERICVRQQNPPRSHRICYVPVISSTTC